MQARSVPTRRSSSDSIVSALDRGREAFERGAWREAFTLLSAAEREGPVDGNTLTRLASAAHLVGQIEESARAWERAHHAALEAGDVPAAAQAAFWVSLRLIFRRDAARGTGWIARAVRMLDDCDADCVQRGYLRFAEAMRAVVEGNGEDAERGFGESAAIAARFGDRSLSAMARHAQGRALIYRGESARGAALLDETLVAIESGEVEPLFVGDIYCSAIAACREMYDLSRASEWTHALDRWCEAQPEAIAYRGPCAIHRAEIVRLHGDWESAALELERAHEWFEQRPAQLGIGVAWYEIAELHRLRGAFDAADDAYRKASRGGFDPQPGLALLRLAQGKTSTAMASIRRSVDEARGWPIRSRHLPALIEVALAANDIDSATTAAAELARIADSVQTPLIRAIASHMAGWVALASNDARLALANLREAVTIWSGLQAPYETARARVLVGLACRMLGDDETATLELDAAREVFVALGARPDALRVEALVDGGSPSPAGALTQREIQVLRLIAKGETNRAIASALRISEKTVARHVSNIFVKTSVSNRAAATSFAHDHGLVGR
jgi:DNA-binding CsgD family transcriptional regulator